MMRTGTRTADEIDALVAAVLRDVPVVDGHNDLPAALRSAAGYAVEGLDGHRPELHTDLPRLRAGGVGAQFWSVWVPSGLPEPEAVVATLEQIDAVYRMVARYPRDLALTCTADAVRAATRTGRIASLLGVEGGHSIASSLAVLRTFARLGVRYMTLTHNDNTPWADSATDEPRVGGLDDTGRAVVAEMTRLGVLVDLSHVSAATMHAVLDVADAPVLFSHSSARALCDHPRNVADDVLARIPGNGGVVQVTFVPYFVSAEMADWSRAADAERTRLGDEAVSWRWPRAPRPGEAAADVAAEFAQAGREPVGFTDWLAAHPRPTVTVAQVADHVDHVREVAGVAHVGIGGDYDGVDVQPTGLEDVSGYPRLLAELARRGWSRTDLEALTGRNVLRVLHDAEQAATEPLWPTVAPR
ncbi:dipeptidase [Pseudonocardia sp. N23]|uniref:dipeptidase n=1 Tax=Pseudonocardia sp. N23 TaxID=1987376 RepID=UPI000C023E58|nr:dipeptidase [Pseudonocardia sp. N23]GAY08276.1 putative dipeptidase [Pseudonocardia sp. N23]